MPIHQDKEAAAAIRAHHVELRDTLRVRVGDLRDAVRAGRSHVVSERAVVGYLAINGWNRLAVGFPRPVGSYVSGRSPEPVNDDEPPSVRLERINPSMAMDASADPVVRPSDERIEHVAWALRANNIEAIVVDTGAEARRLILELVPEGAEVHTAKAKTLEDIGPVAELQESGRFDALRPRYYGGPGTVRR